MEAFFGLGNSSLYLEKRVNGRTNFLRIVFRYPYIHF